MHIFADFSYLNYFCHTMIYILHIQLKDLGTPKIWRQIAVPSTLTFNQLHEVIQIAFGWSDYHLYEFTDRSDMFQEGSCRISIPCADDADYHDAKTTDARTTKISKILSKSNELKYIYDFGDFWEFEIHVIDRIRETIDTPICQDGSGAPPPEDCGGTGGYEQMLKSISTSDEGAESYREWIGLNPHESWNPEEFSHQTRKTINLWLYQHFAID